MPMLDIYLQAEALGSDSEAVLCGRLTDILIEAEGADPTNDGVRQLAWVTVFRPESVYVAGRASSAPRYRLVASVPEGQWTATRRADIVARLTDAVLDAEEGRYPRDPSRVWVFTPEVPEGTWGGSGRLWGLADIVEVSLGDRAAADRYAQRILSARQAGHPVAAPSQG